MEEKLEQITLDIPDGYEFFGINDDNKVVLTKKQPQYPKTYDECCEVLMGKTDFQDFELVLTKRSTTLHEADRTSPEPPYISTINALYKLLICRDAYWKIAGDWKPDWSNLDDKYTISIVSGDKILLDTAETVNTMFAFPTAEMRDAFYENFKELIENCKEVL